MNKRDEFIAEINAACDKLKTAGLPHARDLAKHICRMKQDLKLYDKCMKQRRDSVGEHAKPTNADQRGSA